MKDGDLNRRELIKLGAATTLSASLGVGGDVAAQAPPTAAPAFLTRQELAVLDELSELIIPTDEHSPGASAAKVAAFIDSQLAEAWDEKDRTTWRDGLRPFLPLSAAERLALLTRIAKNESKPEAPDERFFVELKSRVVRAYYTSEIGIKQEMEYKGNTFLPEFVGFDVS
jgi:Gluconate 2-dehydrogenase subunit 3